MRCQLLQYSLFIALEFDFLQVEENRKLKRWDKPCLGLIQDAQFESESGLTRASRLICEIDSGESYTVDVPDHWLYEQMQNGHIQSGFSRIKLPRNTFLDEERAEIKISDLPVMTSPPVGQESPTRRDLAVLEGVFSVLVVRVVASDGETTRSVEDLANSVFGNNANNPQVVNMKSQYDSCSHGKLKFVETDDKIGKNTNISKGATTIYVNTSTGKGDAVMRNAITAQLNEEFDVSRPDELADHVMYCLPPKTLSGVAYAYIDSWNSIYNDEWCSMLSAQMHEVGHNLNLGHR